MKIIIGFEEPNSGKGNKGLNGIDKNQIGWVRHTVIDEKLQYERGETRTVHRVGAKCSSQP